MASERDRFVADLIAALQANEELTSSDLSAAAQPATGRPTTAARHAASQSTASKARGARAPRGVLPPSAFADSDESDDSSHDSSSSTDTDDVQRMFTGLFHARWQSLSSNSSSDSAVIETPQQQLALEAYEKLQFDYPQIPDAQLLALAESYRQVATAGAAMSTGGSSSSLSVAAIPVTNTLVDGIVYLTEKSTETASSDARSILAASVLLVLFESCLRNADHVRARAVLSKLHAPAAAAAADAADAAPVDWSSSSLMDPSAQVPLSDDAEKYAAEEDPDDLSAVYEGDEPARLPHSRSIAPPRTHQPSATPFTAKLQLLASRTFSSAFIGVSTETWSAWGLDRALVAIIELLLLRAPPQAALASAAPQLYGHPHGEWTRYLYILRDRILRAPSASRTAIRALCDLVERLAPLDRGSDTPSAWTRRSEITDSDSDDSVALAPHQLVYRVLAELVVSNELQQRTASAAQRELAAALETLLPRIVAEVERLSAARRDRRSDASASAQDADVLVMLLQLVHFVLAAAPSKRVASERLQATGLLRALLTLVPTASDADAEVSEPWVAPLLRVVSECALWSHDVAAYVARVPKVVGLLPAMATHCRAECALLLVALYQHACHDSAALETWTKQLVEAHSSSSSSSLWDVVVADALFPPSCPTYLGAMTQLHDAVYFLECVIDALASLRRELTAPLRQSVQRVYGTLAHAFAYPALRQSTHDASQALAKTSGADPSATDNDDDEERGEAEMLQFVALRNKLRQCVKTLLLQSNSRDGASVRASSKLD